MANSLIVRLKRELAKQKFTGNELTEKHLTALERKIGRTYAAAEREVEDIIDRYWNGRWETDANGKRYYVEGFFDRDEAMRKGLADGTIEVPAASAARGMTKSQYYREWKKNQIGRGKALEQMRNELAERVIHYNEVAYAYINDATPGLYSLNWTYHANIIEQHTGIKQRIMDEQSVKRLIMEEPNLMPFYPKERALRRGIDLAYSKKIITNSITQGVLTGKSIKQVADELQKKLVGMNRTSALRAARTASRCSSNAGQLASMNAAANMGIDIEKQWLSFVDKRTRDSHRLMYGEVVPFDKPFSNGLMHPADEDGEPGEVYNCRCTMLDVIDGESIMDTHGEMSEEELWLWAKNRRIWKGELIE